MKNDMIQPFIKLIIWTHIIFWGLSCNSPKTGVPQNLSYNTVSGETMGTYYKITYSGKQDIQREVDSLLVAINQSVSTYIPASEISVFNKSDHGITLGPGHFQENYRISKRFFEWSDGYYDPTVMPLVNYWGFGYAGKNQLLGIDSLRVDSILAFVGMPKIAEKETGDSLRLIKIMPETELDFSSVAKGYAVDCISSMLDGQDIDNYLIDIGGEMYLKGNNPRGEKWSIGINTPEEGSGLTESIRYLKVSDKGIATSGNYRNFYEREGIKVSHTINPKTGFPERSKLLSATLLAADCAHADAWATTCMVLGLERALGLLAKHPDIDACLIYVDQDTLAIRYVNDFESHVIE